MNTEKFVTLGVAVLAVFLLVILSTPMQGWSNVTITVVASLLLAGGIYFLIRTRKEQ